MRNLENNSTIFAFSSGSVPSGVGIIRISGPQSVNCVKILTGSVPSKPRFLQLKNFINPKTKQYIDRGLVAWFNKPHSFTGEDIIELYTHGSMAIIDLLYEILSNIDDVRIAEPGEFTKRAFYNKKLNLDQVEGLVDVINAETKIQLDYANKLLFGSLGELTENLRDKMIGLLSKVEATLEFEDDGVVSESNKTLNIKIDDIQKNIDEILTNYKNSRIIRDGFVISIVGPVNVGKSSIINALSNTESSITTDIPGTTRDIVEVKMNLFGYPVVIRDTASLRQTSDFVENLGVERALKSIKESDLIISVTDNLNSMPTNLNLNKLVGNKPIIKVQNKSDLIKEFYDTDLLYISAKTHYALDKLLEKIKGHLEGNFNLKNNKITLIPRKRHYEIFLDVSNALIRFKNQSELELKSEELRTGIRSLGKITGRVDVEDMLDKLFNEFCIGK